MIRNAQPGDFVEVRLSLRKRLPGVVLAVDSEGLRTVATEEGYIFAMPAEMWPSEEVAVVKAVEDLQSGDVVILMTGLRRTVERALPITLPPRYVVEFRENDGYFPRQTVEPGTLYRLAS